MSKLWDELQNLQVPITQVGIIVMIAITAYVWADDLDDAQHETQKQLDQLVAITVQATKDNQKQHEKYDESLDILKLIVHDIKLRRELEREKRNEEKNK